MSPSLKLLLLLGLVILTKSKWVKEMENKGLFQGDIQLDPDERSAIRNEAYASIKGGRWKNAVVPYVITSSGDTVYPDDVSKIEAAFGQYHEHTCLRFEKRKYEREYISFYRGKGCSSHVGFRSGRVNHISLATGCYGLGTVMHEIGHSIGLYHEQSRPDRDQFVTILLPNIEKEMRFNFDKETGIDSLGTAYDYRSMMHYGQTAFGDGKVTIITKDKAMQKEIGNRDGFSGNDIQQVNMMYECRADRKVCGDGTTEGRKCGCAKGYCWSYCYTNWWCYTNGGFKASLNRLWVACTHDKQCEQGWSCGGACTV